MDESFFYRLFKTKGLTFSPINEYEITKNGKQALEAIPIFAEALST